MEQVKRLRAKIQRKKSEGNKSKGRSTKAEEKKGNKGNGLRQKLWNKMICQKGCLFFWLEQ